MGILSKLFGTDSQSVYKTCVNVYKKAKRRRPGKPERDYLAFVILTKPPYDYQFDGIVDDMLNRFQTINELADFIARDYEPLNRHSLEHLFVSRKRNLEFAPEVQFRNKMFFAEFWGQEQ